MGSRLERRLDEIDEKLEALVEDGRPQPHEFISVKLLVILLIVGVVTAIWSDLLMKRFHLKEGKNPALILAISVVSIIVILVLMKRINTHK